MITVHFHGLLKKYGTGFELEVENPAEAVKALCLQIPGLEETVGKGRWHIVRGPLEEKDSDTEESLTLSFGKTTEMHMLPAVEGANGGVMNIVIGAVLVVAGFFTGGSTWGPAMMMMGGGMMLGGIIQMTMKVPVADTDQGSPVDQKASFLFSKPTNSDAQGVAIPRGYGRFMVGSIVISTSVDAEQLLEGSEGVPDLSNWAGLLIPKIFG